MTRRKKIETKASRHWLLGFIVLGLLIVSIFLIIHNLKIADKRKKLGLEVEALEKKITELTEESEGFQSKIFQSNEEESGYLERVARDELNLKREGESVVAFPVIEGGAQVEEIDEEQQNLWQKIMKKKR